MSDAERGQVGSSAAEVYEEFFVPTLFGQWVRAVADAAGVGPGQKVLDVACGTGVLARHAYERVQPGGSVTGVDVNPGMLAVAQRFEGDVEWIQAAAEELPFNDTTFDAVVCQFGMMFFEDRVRALGEMARVLRPGGRLAIAVWASLDEAPGYAELSRLIEEMFGAGVAAGLKSPFVLGDENEYRDIVESAGLRAEVTRVEGIARFRSMHDWLYTDVRGWTLSESIDDAQFEDLLRAAESKLGHYVGEDGSVSFPVPALIATATKR